MSEEHVRHFTVADGKILKHEWYADPDEARTAAGVEAGTGHAADTMP